MKRTPIALLGLIFLFVTACEKEKIVESGELPVNAQTFVTTHFSGETILQVKKEKDLLQKLQYEVILSNNYELEFKETGEIKKVDGNNKSIPESVITPPAILDYVTANFEDQVIYSWEKNTNDTYEIELANGLDLIFDKDGAFLRIDD